MPFHHTSPFMTKQRCTSAAAFARLHQKFRIIDTSAGGCHFWYINMTSDVIRGATSSSFRGGAIFMKFHSMTSWCSFNRGTTFSQTVTYNNNVFLPADTKYMVQTHTFCTTLVNKNNVLQQRWRLNHRCQEKFFDLRNSWPHAICACTEQRSLYQIRWENWWLGLRGWCLGKYVGLGFMLQLEK